MVHRACPACARRSARLKPTLRHHPQVHLDEVGACVDAEMAPVLRLLVALGVVPRFSCEDNYGRAYVKLSDAAAARSLWWVLHDAGIPAGRRGSGAVVTWPARATVRVLVVLAADHRRGPALSPPPLLSPSTALGSRWPSRRSVVA